MKRPTTSASAPQPANFARVAPKPDGPQAEAIATNMGEQEPSRQGPDTGPIVAFDFDGTLTTRDSFTAFLAWRAGPAGYALGLVQLFPDLIAYGFHRDRGRLKAASARVFLRGVSRDELAQACESFAAKSRRLIRPDAEQCWREWKAKGAVMCIVTASPEEVVGPFARALGADVLIGTRLLYGLRGQVLGAFDGANCRGPEKIIRLRARFGEDLRLAAAYGDTSGDREMLALAEERGYRVFKGRP